MLSFLFINTRINSLKRNSTSNASWVIQDYSFHRKDKCWILSLDFPVPKELLPYHSPRVTKLGCSVFVSAIHFELMGSNVLGLL